MREAVEVAHLAPALVPTVVTAATVKPLAVLLRKPEQAVVATAPSAQPE
jgi:hypothetical protein